MAKASPASPTGGKSNRWDMANWSPGKVTILEALGLNWKVHYPKLNATLAADQQASIDTGSSNSDQTVTGGSVTTPASPTQKAWATAILHGIGAPVNNAGIQSLTAWMNHEAPFNDQPPDGILYTNNPMNTTINGYNTVGSVNSVGVKRYATPKDGIAATVATLLGGYPAIVMRLRSGQGLCGWESAEFDTWSGGGYGSVC